MRAIRYFIFIMVCMLLNTQAVANTAWTNCAILDLTAWTPAQRGYLSHVIADAIDNVSTRHSFVNGSLRVCAEETADLSGLESVALQSAAQAAVDAYVEGNSLRQVALDEARLEVQGNNLCAATLLDVENRLDTIQATVQAAIDAIDATNTVAKIKTALTLDNTRRAAVDKQLARCVLGRAILQRERATP